jgi:hypothetical protein
VSTTITLGTNTYTLVALPTSPGLSQLDLTMTDSVAVVSSPFVPGQTQTQAWPGADAWSMTITLPKMARAVAAQWRGFIAGLHGMENVMQIGDPWGATPLGAATGIPLCNGTTNLAMATTLETNGWTASVTGILKAGDYIQVGLRLYQVTQNADSDSTGAATLSIWPSLREAPANGTSIIMSSAKGIFRLAQNARTWHNDFNRLMSLSLKLVEVR